MPARNLSDNSAAESLVKRAEGVAVKLWNFPPVFLVTSRAVAY
jgi:hypothetical protein